MPPNFKYKCCLKNSFLSLNPLINQFLTFKHNIFISVLFYKIWDAAPSATPPTQLLYTNPALSTHPLLVHRAEDELLGWNHLAVGTVPWHDENPCAPVSSICLYEHLVHHLEKRELKILYIYRQNLTVSPPFSTIVMDSNQRSLMRTTSDMPLSLFLKY